MQIHDFRYEREQAVSGDNVRKLTRGRPERSVRDRVVRKFLKPEWTLLDELPNMSRANCCAWDHLDEYS